MLARLAHAGQAGLPYITHPEQIAGQQEIPEAQVVDWLRDMLEDTGVSLIDIKARFGPETASAVDAISRRASEGWADYISRVKPIPSSGR